MEYKVGDRVMSLINDGYGLTKGEYGTVIDFDHTFPVVRWDNHNPARHDADGKTENGHGWYIFSFGAITPVCDVDLGELSPLDDADINSLLF